MTSMPSPTLFPTLDTYDYVVDCEYNYTESPSIPTPPLCTEQAECVILVVVNVLIVLLGLLGNGLVIWVIGFKMRKRRTVTTTWYLSLALSDFIFCATLPFNINLHATGSWNFGLFMCKFVPFILFLHMFSSIFLMLIISVDRCVSVVYAFWAQNNRTIKQAAVAVVVAWLFSMLLSIPSLVVRDTIEDDHDDDVIHCYNNFEMSVFSSTSVPVFGFVLGFVFPLVIITVCYSIIIVRMKNNSMYRSVMTALIVTFIICWFPYHISVLLEINHFHNAFLTMISVTLVHVNSCLNPFLYAFMGKAINCNFLSAFISKMENAFSEERPSESEKEVTFMSQAA